MDEDLLQLQDSMESHSDELLRMDTIFALDDVRRLFKALTKRRFRTGRAEELQMGSEKTCCCSRYSSGAQGSLQPKNVSHCQVPLSLAVGCAFGPWRFRYRACANNQVFMKPKRRIPCILIYIYTHITPLIDL